MISTPILKKLIMNSIIISFLATFLNQLGILEYPSGASYGSIWNVGDVIGLIFAIIAIRLVLRVPDGGQM